MSRASLVELTNLCVICDGSRVLVQDKIGCGVVFPGGHVELGESMLASVIREMREETGLLIEHPVLCGIKDWMRGTVRALSSRFIAPTGLPASLTLPRKGACSGSSGRSLQRPTPSGV